MLRRVVGTLTHLPRYLRMLSTAKAPAQGQIINFSNRFTIDGMTGVFTPAQRAAIPDDTAGPQTQNQISTPDQPAQNPANPNAELYEIPYTMQTGLTRYAPMQPQPPTKITKADSERLHPTSSYSVAKTWLPIPRQQTTLTQSVTLSFSSMENTVSGLLVFCCTDADQTQAAPATRDDMDRFLERWKD